MITVEQIRLLESRVTKAIDRIRLLTEENTTLKRSVARSQERMDELEGLVEQFKSAPSEIEQGVARALDNLERLEDEVAGAGPSEEAASAEVSSEPSTDAPQASLDDEPEPEAIVDSEDGQDEDLDIF